MKWKGKSGIGELQNYYEGKEAFAQQHLHQKLTHGADPFVVEQVDISQESEFEQLAAE